MIGRPRGVSPPLLRLAPLVACGCAAGPYQEPSGFAETPASVSGALSQSDISVPIAAAGVRFLLTPLVESVTRTTAADTYRRLAALADNYGGEPGAVLFLASVHSQEGGEFAAEGFAAISGGIRMRPTGIVPVTHGWSTGRVGPRETEMAVLAFPSDLDLDADLTLIYLDLRTDEWNRIRRRVQAERTRMRVR